jgi:glycosyltransferase involved in cell wall biosynthesis
MKILYLIPKLNVSGGVAKIITTKANFLSADLNHEVAIVTQNKGNEPLFFELNSNIKLFDVILKGNFLNFIISYKKKIQTILNEFKPDLIVIADNGLKSLLFTYIVKTKIPIVLEIHCSKFVSEKENDSFYSKIIYHFIVIIRGFGIKKFKNILVLSEESKKEWNLKKAKIIPNPVSQNNLFSDLNSKKILCVTRNSYEKGLDRIIPICKAIQDKHPDWFFEVFCDEKGTFEINEMIKINHLTNIKIQKPTKQINDAYLKSSIFISTSRFEVFPLVILEAMSFGLPIVAYDCQIGIKSVLNKDFSFLIQDDNPLEFIKKLETLISNKELQVEMGKKGQLESLKYNHETILNQYKDYLNEVVYNEHK